MMGSTAKIFAFLLLATVLFHSILNFMLGNIEDFETVPLPPKKKAAAIKTNFSLMQIDATSKDYWTLVDFASGNTHRVLDPEEERENLQRIQWDMGFQRTKVITNSGVTNPKGAAGVLNLGPVPFSGIDQVPAGDYIEDTRTFGKQLNRGIADWYNYRTRTHNIESKKNAYILKTSQGRYMKMRILNYYCTKKEAECRTAMCPRDEAACLTVEYAFSENGQSFPTPVSADAGASANRAG